MQFSPAQGGLKNIRRVNGPLRRACAHDGVHFIHKENHVPVAPNLRQHIPQPLLKFAPVLRARHQRRHIQAHQPFFLQLGRHISHGHPLGKAFSDGSLTHTGFSHQRRVIFAFPAQNADDHIDFLLPPDHRLHSGRPGHQILAELLQKSQTNFLPLLLHQCLALPAQIVHRLGKQNIPRDAVDLQQLPGGAAFLPGQGQQQVLRADLPAFLPLRLPGSTQKQLPRFLRQALGQGQVRRARAVEQQGHGLCQFRVHPQLPQHQAHIPRLPA